MVREASRIDGEPPRRSLTERASDLESAWLPGGPSSDPVLIRELAGLSALEATDLETDERLIVAGAVLTASARYGDPQRAVALARSEMKARSVVGHANGDVRAEASFWSGIAEAFLLAGQPRFAAIHATTALDFAAAVGDRPAEFRALGLLAASRGLNGEYRSAALAVAAAQNLQAVFDWPASDSHLPLLLARLLSSAAEMSVSGLAECQAALSVRKDEDVAWRSAAATARTMQLMLHNRIAEAIATILTVTNGTEQVGTSPMIRGFALGILADLYLGRGEPTRTLTLLENRQSPAGHALCFDMQRSSAMLQLHRNRDALRTTDACVRLGPEHCLRTLGPILLRRAIAHHRLGNPAAAAGAFEDGLHLIWESGSATPLLTLSRPDVIELLDGVASRSPESAEMVDGIRRRLAAVPMRSEPDIELPRLTASERVLASILRDDASYAALAHRLHLSPNTIKTQIKSLYRKLDVGSRPEAITVLERAGFFE